MATQFRKMVHDTNDRYVELKVGHGDIIYLNGSDTGFKVGSDNSIYTTAGRFVSKASVEDFMRSQGKIKWYPRWHCAKKSCPLRGHSLFLKNYTLNTPVIKPIYRNINRMNHIRLKIKPIYGSIHIFLRIWTNDI